MNNSGFKYWGRRIGVHTLLWLGVLLFFTYYFGYNAPNISSSFLFSLMLMPATIGTSYFVNYFLIPRYLLQKKYRPLILYGIYTVIASTFLIIISFMLAFIFFANLDMQNMAPLTKEVLFVLVGVYIVIISTAAVRLLVHNYNASSSNQKLKTQILESELKLKIQELQYLKNQINPHFLFNTLNTLYGLSLMQSEQTPDTIIRLSKLLDYLLYRSDKEWVSAREEVEHLLDYIELEKIRFSEYLKVQVRISDDIDDWKIAPMLLIPFVENCFKHGGKIDGQLTVNLNINVLNNRLVFQLQNSKSTNQQNKSGGIGIANTRRRLDLVYGKEGYMLGINDVDEVFEVVLELDNINITKKVIDES